MSTTVNLSIIILSRPNEPLLAQTRKSANFADEILVIEEEQITNFAQVRNQALTKAKHEWVLFLDSDEVISPDSVNEIKEIVNENRLDGVYLRRQDIFYNKPLRFGEAGRIKLLRMGKKSKMAWNRPVHEVVAIDGLVEESNIRLLHYAHSSIDEFINSVINYAYLEAKYRLDQKMSFSSFQMIFYPPAKFIFNYIIKLGFPDGWRGLCYAMVMSLHSLAVRVFQYELEQQKS